jgi:hypothetical protein
MNPVGRFFQNYRATSNTIPGLHGPPLLGFALGAGGAMGRHMGQATLLQAIETLIAGSPNSTLAPGSTALFGEGLIIGPLGCPLP